MKDDGYGCTTMKPRPAVGKWMMIFGLITVGTTFWSTIHFTFPFYAHTYPFAWYGFIVFIDGLLWWRWNEGLILARPREFVTLLFWSAVFWFFFEIWNLRFKNWFFVGAPAGDLWPHVEAYLNFATVLPGMFLVYRLICRLKIPKQVKTRFVLKTGIRKACPIIGIVMIVLPLIYPDYFFPLVWGSLIFLLEPVCARWGGRSLLADAERGEWTTFVRLLIAGLVCGGYWELCNFWSLEKWVYSVPFFSQGKLFEMPYLGFLGFPPFCVQCFVMLNAVYLLRGNRHWDPEAPLRKEVGRTIRKPVYWLMIVFCFLLSEWSYSKMNAHTVESYSETLRQTLEDISPSAASKLTNAGWRYPEEVLKNWDEAKTVIQVPLRDRIHDRLGLVTLAHMGWANARLLEGAGVDSPKKLAAKNPDELFPELTRVNRSLQLRQTPLVKRRIVALINAAKRRSAVY